MAEQEHPMDAVRQTLLYDAANPNDPVTLMMGYGETNKNLSSPMARWHAAAVGVVSLWPNDPSDDWRSPGLALARLCELQYQGIYKKNESPREQAIRIKGEGVREEQARKGMQNINFMGGSSK